MSGIVTKSVALAAIAVCVITFDASADRRLHLGIGGGVVLQGAVGVDGTSRLGKSVDLALEYVAREKLAVRFRASWMDFGEQPAQDVIERAETLAGYGQRTTTGEDLRFVGGSLDFLLLDQTPGWGSAFFLFGFGGYKVTGAGDDQVGLLIGPGFGVYFLNGSPNIGIELHVQAAVFERGSTLLVPLKLFVNF